MRTGSAGAAERHRLRRSYLRLGTGELVAAGGFALVAVRFVVPRLGDRGATALWFALVPLLVVLVQAGAYWLAARSWVCDGTMPVGLAALYRVFRVVDVGLLLLGLAGVLLWLPSTAGGAVFVLAVWAFGVVEYLNYFVVRLSYPLRQWFTKVGQWRTPQLVKDLARAR